MSHFVYLYRDKSGKPRYVGYGEDSQRALSHMTQTHNATLETLLKDETLKLEIAGPFLTKEAALAVETALISALVPDANIARGETMHRFRPIGVPVQFAERFSLSPLSRGELSTVLKAHQSPHFLCVLIKNVDFDDGMGGIRKGYDPANPLGDKELLERVTRWWPLRRKVEEWSHNPAQSPQILLAIHGKPGAQFIIASVVIDRSSWERVPLEHDVEVPTLDTPNLDAAELRGRRIDREAGLKFNLGGLILFPS